MRFHRQFGMMGRLIGHAQTSIACRQQSVPLMVVAALRQQAYNHFVFAQNVEGACQIVAVHSGPVRAKMDGHAKQFNSLFCLPVTDQEMTEVGQNIRIVWIDVEGTPVGGVSFLVVPLNMAVHPYFSMTPGLQRIELNGTFGKLDSALDRSLGIRCPGIAAIEVVGS